MARILLIADDQPIREQIRGILGTAEKDEPVAAAHQTGAPLPAAKLEVDAVGPVQEGLRRFRRSIQQRRFYALVVIDLDVSQAQDALDAVHGIWEEDPAMPLLLCTAAGCQQREEILRRLGQPDRVSLVRKPLDPVELRQLAALRLDRRRLQDELRRCTTDRDSIRRALEDARHKAQAAEQAKEEFMANVSHEIRTPLNAIMGFSGLLLKEPLGAEQLERLHHIHQAGQGLLNLIDKLLDFSKLVTGKLQLRSVLFDPDQVITEVVQVAQTAARAKGLLLQYHTEAAVPRSLRGDSARLRQILFSLVDNAIKFTEQGAVHIQTALDDQTEHTATLRLVVTDTGVGIPVDRQAVVFESFAQADGSSTRQVGGIGLGLAICKQLADLMGGQIGLRSAVGEGSSFWVTLPFEKRVDHQGKTPAAAPAAEGAPPAELGVEAPGDSSTRWPGKPHILVVEDDRLNRTLLEVLLARAGCIVDLVGNRDEALTVLAQNRYAMVFLDVGLPTADGLKAIEQIREREAGGTRVPLVAMIASAGPGDRERCLRAGADDCVDKPVAFEALFGVVRRYLPGVPESSSGAAPADSPAPSAEQPDLSVRLNDCLEALRKSLDSRNLQGVERHARTIKSMALEAGLKAVADHAMRLQLAARSSDLSRVAAAAEILNHALPGGRKTAPAHDASPSICP